MGKLKLEVVRALLSTGVPMSIPCILLETSSSHQWRIGSVLREMEEAGEVAWIKSMSEILRCGYQLTPIGVRNYSMLAMEKKHGRIGLASVS